MRREAKTWARVLRADGVMSFMGKSACASVRCPHLLTVMIRMRLLPRPRTDRLGPDVRPSVPFKGVSSSRTTLLRALPLNGLVPTLLLALALAAPATPLLARETVSQGADSVASRGTEPASVEGIPVPKRSRVAGLASSEALEQQGSLQYRQLLEQASAKRALAPADHPQRQRLIRIARNLLPYTERFSPRAREWKWEVNLIASNTINAFVMPGGKVVFFTGIIERLKLSDDEIAMIMGHEMAHALLEHGRERVGQERVAQAATIGASVLSQVLGFGDLGGMIAQGTSKLTLLSFNRGDETDADLVGMDIAARAGYDPRAAVSLWEKMSAASKGEPPQFLSTHPAHGTRIDTLRAALPKVMPLYERARAKR